MNIETAIPYIGPSASTENHVPFCCSVLQVLSATVPSVNKSAIQGINVVHLVVRINCGFCNE